MEEKIRKRSIDEKNEGGKDIEKKIRLELIKKNIIGIEIFRSNDGLEGGKIEVVE